MRSIIRFAINFAIVLLLLQFATALAITFAISYVLWMIVDAYITHPQCVLRTQYCVRRSKHGDQGPQGPFGM